jgi:protein-disulfide isomerase
VVMQCRATSVLVTHDHPSVSDRVTASSHFASLMLAAAVVAVGCRAEGSGEPVSVAVPAWASASLDATEANAKPSGCRMLVTELCSQFGAESGVCRRIRSRSERFSDERCEAMLEHYDEVAAEARRVEEGKKALLAAHGSKPLGHPPWFGPADAKVTLVEFSDFTCSECARGSPVAQQIRNRHPGVRFVFRQGPLATRPEAHRVAEASLAAHAQGKFWEYHDLLFSNQHDLSDSALRRYAKEVGLDLGRFRKALDTREYAAEVDADLKLGKMAMVGKPPAMFVNSERVDFPYEVVALDEAIDGAKADR